MMLKRIFITMGIFYILFFPPIFGFHSLRVIAAISLLYILLRLPNFRYIYNLPRIEKLYLTLLIIIAWISLVIIMNGESIGSVYSYIYWLLSVIPASLMIGNEIRKDRGDLFSLMDFILSAGFIQGLCSISAFFIPGIKNFFLSRMVSAEVLNLSHYGYYVDIRLYGFANGLTYAMPVLQAFLTMVAVYLSLNRSVKYFIVVPFTLFSAIVNARTSIVILVVCGGVLLFQRKGYSVGQVYRLFLLIVGIIALVFAVMRVLQEFAPYTFLWISDGFKQIELFFSGDFESGYFSYLTNRNRWQLPSGLGVVFGEGIRIMGKNLTGVYSDVGYVNDVWLGGVTYCIVIYALVLYYSRKTLKHCESDNAVKSLLNYLVVSLLLCSILLNLKGYVVNLNCISNFYILLLVFQQLTRSRNINIG